MYFVREGQHVYLACGEAEHLCAHRISPDRWRAVGAMARALLATAKMGAAVVNQLDEG